MGLDLDVLRKANDARQEIWGPELKLTGLFHSNELAEEVGEACGVVKKLVHEAMGLKGKRKTVRDLGEELADVVIVADLLARKFGLNLTNEIVNKFNITSEDNGISPTSPHRKRCDLSWETGIANRTR